MRRAGTREFSISIALFLVCSWVGSSDSISIVRPSPSEAVVLDDDGGMTIEIEMEHTVVPKHGFIAVHVDNEQVAVYCPGLVSTLAHCPSNLEQAGQLEGSEIKLAVGKIKAGERALTVELVDQTHMPLEEASVAFWAMERHEVDKELPENGPVFNAIIFSKDRASQLDQLLSSIEAHVRNLDAMRIQVLYTFSESSFKKGYDQLMPMHPHVTFCQEGNMSSTISSTYAKDFVRSGGSPDGFKVRSAGTRGHLPSIALATATSDTHANRTARLCSAPSVP